MRRRLPSFPLFPYTTLFRSGRLPKEDPATCRQSAPDAERIVIPLQAPPGVRELACTERLTDSSVRYRDPRSEEHTSELQSHVNLVCRLLLEKKNNSWDVVLR